MNEQIAHAGRTDAHEHLDKIRTGNGKEGHAGLAGHGPGHEGLARSGAAHQEHALGNAASQARKLLGVAQKIDDLLQLLLGLVHTRHISKGDLGLLLGDHLGPGPPKGHGLSAPSLHLPHEKNPHTDQKQHREPGNEDRHIPRRLFLRFGFDLHVVLDERVDQGRIVGRVGTEAAGHWTAGP